MNTLLLAAVLLSGVAPAEHGDCAQLTQLKLPDVRITEAVAVPASSTGIKVAHCRVTGVIGTEIKFALLMPDDWNRKFLMGGGGGFVGSVQNQAQFVVNAGYATAGTDTGHTGGTTDATWALNNLERQVNFGYLARAPHRRGVEGDSAQLLRGDARRAPIFPAARTADARR